MVQMSVVCLTWNCLSTWIFFTVFSTSKLAAYPGPKLKFPLSIPSWPNTLMINAGWPVTLRPEAWRLHTRWTKWMAVEHLLTPPTAMLIAPMFCGGVCVHWPSESVCDTHSKFEPELLLIVNLTPAVNRHLDSVQSLTIKTPRPRKLTYR